MDRFEAPVSGKRFRPQAEVREVWQRDEAIRFDSNGANFITCSADQRYDIFTGLLALAPCHELKQTGCSYRVGFVLSEYGLQVRCPGKKGIEVIFDYFGQRFIE